MKRITKTIILSLLTFWCIAQTEGTILVFSNQPSVLLVDGEKVADVQADIPKKLSLSTGDHYIQAVNKELGLNKGEMVTIKEGNNPSLKIVFKEESKQISGPIAVAEINFMAPGLTTLAASGTMSNKYSYAFAKDDEVLIDVSMSNKKGTNTIKIYSYPDYSVKYQNLAFEELSKFKFIAEETGIYIFEIGSNHIFDRNCNFKLRRNPASEETRDFNTKVRTEKIYKAVEVVKKTEAYINSETNFGGNTTIAVPVRLPIGTEKWYYSVYASRDKNVVAQQMKSYSLLENITSLLGPYGKFADLAANQLTKPPGSDFIDVFLITHTYYNAFVNENPFSYQTSGTRENVKSAVVDLPCCYQEPIYLGLRNRDFSHGVDVVIEAVALVPEIILVMD